MFMYVDALHSFTHVMAADSVSCFEEDCDPSPFLTPSASYIIFEIVVW